MTSLSRRAMVSASLGTLLSARAFAAAASGASNSAGAPAKPPADAVQTGGSQTIRIDGRYNVWVKRVGSSAMPVLTLHGGPGMNHMYFECFEDFLPAAGLSFFYYDQLGCGFSDVPKDKTLWVVDRYIEEVEQVRRALGEERTILFGHSWGSMLAMKYAVRYPKRVGALILSNMTASIPSLGEYTKIVIKKLLQPAELDVVAKTRETGNFSDPEYQRIVKKVYSHTLCRLDPWPEPITRSERFMNEEIYTTMCGPDDLNVTGNLKDWDFWDRLPKISAPTLVLGAQNDEMAPEQLKRMGSLIPQSSVAICPNGGHYAMYDDQRAYFNALIPFIRAHAAAG